MNIHGQENRSCPPSANQGVSKAEPIGSVSPVELVQPWQYWFLRREKWHCWDSDFHDVPDEAYQPSHISFQHWEFGKNYSCDTITETREQWQCSASMKVLQPIQRTDKWRQKTFPCWIGASVSIQLPSAVWPYQSKIPCTNHDLETAMLFAAFGCHLPLSRPFCSCGTWWFACGQVVKALDYRPRGPRFQPHYSNREFFT